MPRFGVSVPLTSLSREWLKSNAETLDLPNLSKEERYYCHRWCDCWVGITHESSGDGNDRVLHLKRASRVYRRQLQTEEKHPDDALKDESDATTGPESSSSNENNPDEAPLVRKRTAARMNKTTDQPQKAAAQESQESKVPDAPVGRPLKARGVSSVW